MNPKWRLFAKLRRWSTQIPVRVATSESVNIFWLALTVTTALGPLFFSALPGPTRLDAGLILRAALCKSNSRSVLKAKNEAASTLGPKSQENSPFLHAQRSALELVLTLIQLAQR